MTKNLKPSPTWLEIIDKYYLPGEKVREILFIHSVQVARKAVEIAKAKNLPLDLEEVYTAGMLHDIGIFLTDAPGIACMGTEPYIRHGVLGAKLLRDNGYDEKYARVAERHTGTGLTQEDIKEQNLPLPLGDYTPETLLEKLICYADKFYSKSKLEREKTLEEVRRTMTRHGQKTLERFEELHQMFSSTERPHL